MYGSQFHFEQTLASKKFSAANYQHTLPLPQIKTLTWIKFSILLIGLSASSFSFASPSEIKFKSLAIFSSHER
ncbi:hypothetical protein SHI21_15630 [Bacteriovorax sp. PP10]|uniref:Uncharacterized protein n=1 Tax=Bacteriovorax antarcticus TaxID=3088717 RepID=A0ABU5W1G2_9BACT|nr:hypothetical protein [Bacteriovorax sp. PP10]MEA9357660.1 hypothetical protein [Bacteriovorax sp. PP10]